MNDQTGAIRDTIQTYSPCMCEFLTKAIRFPSISGNESAFVHFVADWARDRGFETDLWQAQEAELLARWPVASKHLPLRGRPTLVVRLPGKADGPSLAFNAHSDVVAAEEPSKWTHGPWAGALRDGYVFGRGACDTKGPLTSALLAMEVLKTLPAEARGDIYLELIPGEEDCVGLGTLTSVARGYKPDGLIVLEPTECQPRCASRGGSRFEIICTGKSIHGTVKWQGIDAIAMLRDALACLERMEQIFSDSLSEILFSNYPLQRPITVDVVNGGRWQGMICDWAKCAGYFEYLPQDDTEHWQGLFVDQLHRGMIARGHRPEHINIRFVESYQGHMLAPEHPLAASAAEAVARSAVTPARWQAFNSGCEAGVRATLFSTPTLVWGPGSLVHAHAVDERVEWAQVERVAEMFVHTALLWTGGKKK